MSTNVTIVPLGDVPSDAMASAVAILNESQDQFDFQLAANRVALPDPDIAVTTTADGQSQPGYSWDILFRLLEQARVNASAVVGVLEKPIEKNFFAKGDRARGMTIASSFGWADISTLPASIYLSNTIVHACVWSLVPA